MDKLRAAARARKAYKEESKLEYQEQSRERLLKIIIKKLQTSFIGALSAFEQDFGHCWGHDKSNPTFEEDRNYRKYQETRKKVLNNGNNQIRAIEQELQQYTINWNRYNLEMEVSDGKE